MHVMMNKTVHAPWTKIQVDALNYFQTQSGWHPYTCGNDRHDKAHCKYQAEHGGDRGQLVATETGWICPVHGCGYTQSWATELMFTRPENPIKTLRILARKV